MRLYMKECIVTVSTNVIHYTNKNALKENYFLKIYNVFVSKMFSQEILPFDSIVLRFSFYNFFHFKYEVYILFLYYLCLYRMRCVPFFTQNSNLFLSCKNKTRTHKHRVLRRELQTVLYACPWLFLPSEYI